MSQYETRPYNWMMTISSDQKLNSLVDESLLRDFLDTHCKSWIYQLENGGLRDLDPHSVEYSQSAELRDTTKDHWQVYFSLVNKMTKSNLLKIFDESEFPRGSKGIHLEPAKNAKKSIEYCKKEESRISPPIASPDIFILPEYRGEDLTMIENTPLSWQIWLFDFLKQIPDDRSVNYIWNQNGCLGKSKTVKYLCHGNKFICLRVPFGSASQIREIITNAGPRQVYFIDIPKTLGKDEDWDSIVSVIEDLKGGFVQSFMRGKLKQLLMRPPHVFVFTNHLPNPYKFVPDRSKVYKIDDQLQTEFVALTYEQHFELFNKDRQARLLNSLKAKEQTRRLSEKLSNRPKKR